MLPLAERERVSVTNFASTMVTVLVNNPLAPFLDLTSLRVVSCGGSPQSPAIVARAIALFGCEFFLSYGMTECCGKISMSILPGDDVERLAPVDALARVCTSGKPFALIDVCVVDENGQDVPRDSDQVRHNATFADSSGKRSWNRQRCSFNYVHYQGYRL